MPLITNQSIYLPRRKPVVGTMGDPRTPLSMGLVGAWLFNEGAAAVFNAANAAEAPSSIVLGSSGLNPTWRIGARFGPELRFNGASSTDLAARIVVSTSTRYSLQAQSFVAWVHTEAIQSIQPGRGSAYEIVSRSQDITTGGWEWAVNWNAGSPRLAYAYYDGSVQGWYMDSTVLADGTDYVLAGTWTPGSVSFYINGILSSTVGTTSGTITNLAADPLQLAFQGTSSNNQNSSFEGALQHLLLYSRVLTAHEMALLVAEPFAPYYRPRGTPPRVFDLAPPPSGAQTVNPNPITTLEQVFNPSVLVAQTVNPNAIGTAEQLFAPAVTLQVLPGTIATGENVRQPTLTLQVRPNAIATAESVFQPVVTLAGGPQTIMPGTIATGAVVYAPQVIGGPQTVSPNLITSGEAVYAPTVSGGGGPITAAVYWDSANNRFTLDSAADATSWDTSNDRFVLTP